MENLLTSTTLILGTILSVIAFFKFDVICFGWKGILALWSTSVFFTGLIMAIFGELLGFVFTIVWFLIKIGLVVCVIGFLYYLIARFIKGRKTS